MKISKLLVVGLAALSSTTFSQIQTNEINSTGKVGIGTMAPTESLEVNGNTKIDGDMIVKDSVTVDKNMTIKQDMKVKGDGTFTGLLKAKSDMKVLGTAKMKGNAFVEGNFKFKALADPAATDDRFLMINANGKAKSLAKNGFITQLYTPTPCLALPDGTIPTFWSSKSTPSYGVLYTGAGACGGRVGIGTDDPQVELEIVGSVFVSNQLKVGTNSIWLGGTDLATGSNNNFFSTDDLYIQSSSANPYNTIINFNNTGNVGIGIDAPAHKLEVAGTVRACKFIAEANSWCDYVFAEDYELMPLNELEAYIQKEKHLPDVPSESEVIENGNDLNVTDKALLKKVEELTLYTIEQQKMIEELRAEVNKLKSQD